jgi:DNA-binding NtrC family response regulator
MATKQGLFEIASDGTLFLDEIAEMEITVQARLLKALEEKRFRRVGGIRDLTTNFRLIAATNRDLAQEVTAGRFRNDLYYRLNVVRVRMPPLRERFEDLPLLVEVILRPLAKEMGRPLPTISPRALKKLEKYPWPGNVRELRNVLERAMLTMAGKEIRSEDLLLDTGTAPPVKSDAGLPTQDWEIRPLDDVINDYVAASVEAAGGNVRKTARQLQISPSTLYARLKAKSPAPSS